MPFFPHVLHIYSQSKIFSQRFLGIPLIYIFKFLSIKLKTIVKLRNETKIPIQISMEKGEKKENIRFFTLGIFARNMCSLCMKGRVKSTKSSLSPVIVKTPAPISYLFIDNSWTETEHKFKL